MASFTRNQAKFNAEQCAQWTRANAICRRAQLRPVWLGTAKQSLVRWTLVSARERERRCSQQTAFASTIKRTDALKQKSICDETFSHSAGTLPSSFAFHATKQVLNLSFFELKPIILSSYKSCNNVETAFRTISKRWLRWLRSIYCFIGTMRSLRPGSVRKCRSHWMSLQRIIYSLDIHWIHSCRKHTRLFRAFRWNPASTWVLVQESSRTNQNL